MFFGGNADVKGSPIWEIAERNNKKPVEVVYRINGVKVSKDEYIISKMNRNNNG